MWDAKYLEFSSIKDKFLSITQHLWTKLVDVNLIQRLEELLFYAIDEKECLRDYSLSCLINFAKYGSMRMRIQMAQQSGLIR